MTTDHGSDSAGAEEDAELVGRFYAWWRGDPLSDRSPTPNLTIEASENAADVTTATGMSAAEVRERMNRGNQPWLARIDADVAGWGWVAHRGAEISELGIQIVLPPGERYLWDFVTPPDWRGHGVYTALLAAILWHAEAGRYWIGHDEGNDASARGILRAGFRQVGTAQRTVDGRIVFVPDERSERADAAASILGLPVIGG